MSHIETHWRDLPWSEVREHFSHHHMPDDAQEIWERNRGRSVVINTNFRIEYDCCGITGFATINSEIGVACCECAEIGD